jgi:hypothetical protein
VSTTPQYDTRFTVAHFISRQDTGIGESVFSAWPRDASIIATILSAQGEITR